MEQVKTRVENQFDISLREAVNSNLNNVYRVNSQENRLKLMGRGYVRHFLNNPDSLDLLSPRLSELFVDNRNGVDSQGDLRSWCLIHGLTLMLVNNSISVEGHNIDRLIDEVLDGIES